MTVPASPTAGQRVVVRDASSRFCGIAGTVVNVARIIPGMSDWRRRTPVDVRLDRAPDGETLDSWTCFAAESLEVAS